MVILDTTIIIDHLRVDASKKSILRQIEEKVTGKQLGISIVTVQELYAGLSTKNQANENVLLATIGGIKILPYTYEVAETAGKILRDNKIIVGFADAAIAATAIVNGCDLLTLNKSHFKGIPDLEIL